MPRDPDALRKRCFQRARNYDEKRVINPDTQQFITSRKRYHRKANLAGGARPVPKIFDCRDCPLTGQLCPFGGDLTRCSAPSLSTPCGWCGQMVEVRIIEGVPIQSDATKYRCPGCRASGR